MNCTHIIELVTVSKILFRLSMIFVSFGVVDKWLLLENVRSNRISLFSIETIVIRLIQDSYCAMTHHIK
jgi:hypothetical protein